MKRLKLGAIGLILFGPVLLFAAITLTDKRSPDEVRYDQLLSARRAEARFEYWGMKPWCHWLSVLTRFDPVEYYYIKGSELKRSLAESRALVYVSFFIPPPSSNNFLRPGSDRAYIAAVQPSGAQYLGGAFSNNQITLLCRPQDIGLWQIGFCTITNEVRREELRQLVHNRINVACQLPCGRVVDLDSCVWWLNESTAKGWMVGICESNYVLIVSRRKPAG